MQVLFLTHLFCSLFSLSDSCRRHGQVRPDGGKEPLLDKGCSLLHSQRQGWPFLGAPIQLQAQGTWAGCSQGHCFLGIPPSQKNGLCALCPHEYTPNFIVLPWMLFAYAKAGTGGWINDPLVHLVVLGTFKWLNINEPGGVCVCTELFPDTLQGTWPGTQEICCPCSLGRGFGDREILFSA